MSEFINNSEKRLEDLLAFSLGVMNGENVRTLMVKYDTAIKSITPHDMLRMEDRQIKMGITPQMIKSDIEKVMNVFFKSLESYEWEKPTDGSFLYFLLIENDAFKFKLNQVKKILKSFKGKENEQFEDMKKELLPKFREFLDFETHYVKKENILFPYLEKTLDSYRPLNVMWSLHDDIRQNLKEIINMLLQQESTWNAFNKKLGKYYFLVFGMIQKENLIIYPVAAEALNKEIMEEMHFQSFEYGFPFIETPNKPEVKSSEASPESQEESRPQDFWLQSETGQMSFKQALMVFNHLPVDITVVDENDEVLFFNRAKDRFFPRSPAIIGRTVQNCHPPESVHIVEKIVSAFRNGEKDHADFWIQMKGKFILIQYFALRDENQNYRGVVEVSQDATGIRQLEGEKRLLEWN